MNLNTGGWASPLLRLMARLRSDGVNSTTPVTELNGGTISATNADIALVAKGTGATLAQVPDGTIACGDKRGTYATDWQKIRATVATRVASGPYSVIGGGISNTASSGYSTVAGGSSNTASTNEYATIGGGSGNQCSGNFGTISGGQSNNVSDLRATISGGFANTASISSSFVGGGSSNTAQTNTHATVCGGSGNAASGQYSFVGGGQSNTTSSSHSFVGGGQSNTASANTHATVCGGSTNTASGQYSFIGSGISNTNAGPRGVIIGGQTNDCDGSADDAVICGGANNTANSAKSFISGGAYGTTRTIAGYHVFPACNRPIATTQGVTQSALLLLARETTDATATVLRSNTSAASATNQVTLPNNSAYSFSGEVIAGVTGAGNSARWTIDGAIKRGANAASTVMVGTPTVVMTHFDAGAATWVVAVTANATLGCITVTVTGAAATTIRWVCRINTVEMTY